MKLIEFTDIQKIADTGNGFLVVAEQQKNIPFDIKRVYCIFCSEREATRGMHAHKALQQAMVCLNGSCKVTLDDGKVRESVTLNSPSKALLIGKNIWREMTDFSDNCILMVFASELYSEEDYIRNYDDFLSYLKENEETVERISVSGRK